VVDGVTGLLSEPANIIKLAMNLQKLVDNPLLRDVMATNGRLRFESQFQAQRMISALSQIYYKALAKENNYFSLDPSIEPS